MVELFRNKNRQRWNNNNENVIPPPRKDQPHQELRVESDLTFDESFEAMEEEDDPKALSIIYESDEESDDEEAATESIGGLMPEMPNQAETGSVDYESDESEGDEVEDQEYKLDEEEEEESDEVVSATEEESSVEAPFAGQVDWPWPEEEEEIVVPTSAAEPLREPKPTTRVPPGFANTRAKAYVLLWEKRIRRFDQSQVNVVQKSATPPTNVIQSTHLSNNMIDSRKDVVVVTPMISNANVNVGMTTTTCGVTSSKTHAPHAVTATSSPTWPNMKADTRDDEVIHHEVEKRLLLANNNNRTPVIVTSTTPITTTTRSKNSVRDEVMNWENKLRNIHKDAQYVLLGM